MTQRKVTLPFIIVGLLASCSSPVPKDRANKVALYLTAPDQQFLIALQDTLSGFSEKTSSLPAIVVNEAEVFQPIDGFGFTLSGGSAILINQMSPEKRSALLRELFTTENGGIGISYLRLSIGASDLSDHVFSYNDLPDGQTDPDLARFSIEEERKDLLPVLKEILAVAPNIKIMGSPWSPPVWMKTNGSSIGGSLKPEYYDAYALYFVKYIQAMKAEGIAIDAITVQNEPLHPGNNPSLLMQAEEQAEFVGRSLGPAFEKAGIATKIVVYDHNADRPDYPITILNDSLARKYVDGSAFHLYGGEIGAVSTVHDAYPDKNLYFTEQWVGAPGNFAGDFGWHIKNVLIGATRNWCRTVLEWNLAADPTQSIHTEGGCTACLGAITIDNGEVTARNPAYYVIAQASAFVEPGSVRIASNTLESLNNVAFKTPSGKRVLVVQNESGELKKFSISSKDGLIETALPAGGVGTYVW